MLYIEENEKLILPKRYHLNHNICVIIHDLIAEILKLNSYKDLRATSINLSKDEQNEIDKFNNDEVPILTWLESKGFKDEIEIVLSKQLLTRIVEDFCHFIFESLSCAKKGKMSVAYTLLRKPLTDELLLLEQLLIDRTEFIERFYYKGDSKYYDPSAGSFTTQKIKDVIKKSVDIVNHFPSLDSDLIFQLRYEKTHPNGLNWLMQHAHHIVTTDPRYKTENQNLNFVFSIDKDYKRYWDHYYYFIPYLLTYASVIIDKITFALIGAKESLRLTKELRKLIALVFWYSKGQPSQRKSSNNLLKRIGQAMAIKCPKCKSVVIPDKADFKLYLEIEQFYCPECFSPLMNSKKLLQKIKSLFPGLES